MHPELDEEFIVKADKTDLDDELPAAELRKAWREVNDKLTAAMEKLSAALRLTLRVNPSTIAQGRRNGWTLRRIASGRALRLMPQGKAA